MRIRATHRVVYCNGWFVPQRAGWCGWKPYLYGCIDVGGHWDEVVAFDNEAAAWKHIKRFP